MSKRSEKKKRAEERRKEERKKTLIGAAITMTFAGIMLALGLIGFFMNRAKFNDYTNSTDVRKVEGTVTGVEVKSRDDEYGRKYYYYMTKVFYTVDNVDYEDKTEFDTQYKIGDTVEVTVYKTSVGEYRIPEVTNETAYKMYNMLYIGVAIFGFVLILIGIFVLLPDKKDGGKNNSKKKK